MRVNAVRMQTSDKNRTKLTPAKTGALLTAGVLGASTAISWVSKPEEMCKVVNNCGGFKKYAKNYVLGLSLLSGVGAVINASLMALSKKVEPKENPKAVN